MHGFLSVWLKHYVNALIFIAGVMIFVTVAACIEIPFGRTWLTL